MNASKIALISFLLLLGTAFCVSEAKAQFAPGFGFSGAGFGTPLTAPAFCATPFRNAYAPQIQTAAYFSPFGGINTINQTVTPWLRQTTYNQTYINPLTGVAYQRQVFSNPYGTFSTVRGYDPFFGAQSYYQQSNFGPVDPYNYGTYRPGFNITIRR